MSSGSEDGGDRIDNAMAFIRPERRLFVRERMAALQRYEAIDRPTVEDADAYADRFGMTRVSFYRLVRAWRASRDPASLAGPGANYGARGPQRTDADRWIAEKLRSMRGERSIERDVIALEEAAAEDGVQLPSRATLRKRVASAREASMRDPARLGRTLAVGHLVLEVPVDEGDGATMPLATVVVRPAAGVVLAASLSFSAPSPATVAAALVAAIKPTVLAKDDDPAWDQAVAIDADKAAHWTELFDVLARHGVARMGRTGPRIIGERLVGSTAFPVLLGFRARPRYIHRPASERRAKAGAQINVPVDLATAQATLDARIRAQPQFGAWRAVLDPGFVEALRTLARV